MSLQINSLLPYGDAQPVGLHDDIIAGMCLCAGVDIVEKGCVNMACLRVDFKLQEQDESMYPSPSRSPPKKKK